MSRDLNDPLRQKIQAVKQGDVVGIRKNLSFSSICRVIAHLAVPINIIRSFPAAVLSFVTATSVPKVASGFTRTVTTTNQDNTHQNENASFSAVAGLSTPTGVPFDTTGTFTASVTVVAI
jgi:hypothetical protein